jgi:hypothetical protein
MNIHNDAPKEGFAAVAEWMAIDPDNETFVLRRFNDMSARNLLYLQCEILTLRKRFDSFDRKVARIDADMDLKDAAMTWETLLAQNDAGNVDAREYMTLVLELRKKIKDYRKALSHQEPEINVHLTCGHLQTRLSCCSQTLQV